MLDFISLKKTTKDQHIPNKMQTLQNIVNLINTQPCSTLSLQLISWRQIIMISEMYI